MIYKANADLQSMRHLSRDETEIFEVLLYIN